MSHRFAEFELDLERCELRRSGQRVPLEPQVFRLLEVLIDRRDRVVSRDELLDAVWGNRFVSEATLSHRILEARRALGDDGRTQRWIRTIHGRGFRFVGSVAGTAGPTPASELPGRSGELARLRELQERGSGTMFVAGPAGQGKTTLVQAFVQTCAVPVARGQCLDHQTFPEPFLPVFDALGRRGREDPTVVARLLAVAPTWLVHLPALVDEESSRVLEGRALGSTRPRMLRELGDALEALAPLILVLEDLHQADESTLDAVRWLTQRPRPGVWLLATYRLEPTCPVAGLARELTARGQAAHLLLPPLDEAAAVQILARRGCPAELAGLLVRRSGGNPLFMESLLDGWQAANLLEAPEPARLEAALPDSLRDLIHSQVARLDPAARRLLEAAAVAGEETFASALAAAGADIDEEQADATCHELALRGAFLEARGETTWPDGTVSGTFAFVHDVFRETLYRWLPAATRARMHGRVAHRLLRAWPGQEPTAELARHFERSPERERAIPFLVGLAERALGRGGAGEALLTLEAALRCSPSPQWEAHLQALRSTALVWLQGWSCPEALGALERALELAQAGSAERSQLLFSLATLHEMRGEYERCRSVLEERLQQGESGVDCHELLACTTYHQGDFHRSLEAAERGLALYDPCQVVAFPTAHYGDNPGVSCYAWGALASWFLGDPDGALERSRASLSLARSGRHDFALALACCQAASLHQWRDEPAAALEFAEEGAQVAQRSGFPHHQAHAEILAGWAECRLGRPSGLPRLSEGLGRYRTFGANLELPYFLLLQAECRLAEGQAEAAALSLREALAITAPGRNLHIESELWRLLARAEPQQGRDHLARAGQVAARLQSPPLLERVRQDAESSERPG